MDPETDKLRLFVNPFAFWTDFALKTGQAMWATAHAAAVRANGPRVAVIPTADAPQEKVQRRKSRRRKFRRRSPQQR